MTHRRQDPPGQREREVDKETAMNPLGRSLLKETDLTAGGFLHLVNLGSRCRAAMLAAIPRPAEHHRPVLGDFAGSGKIVAAQFG